MPAFSEVELREAARAIASTRMKSEKAISKLKEASAQQRLTARGIAAYTLALALIARELEETPENAVYSKEELEQALETCASVCSRVESILPKLSAGTSQHTLAVRRIRAFEIASALIQREITAEEQQPD